MSRTVKKLGQHATHQWGTQPGVSKLWKRRLHKAQRKLAKERLDGRRGKEPIALTSLVNSRGHSYIG